MIIIVLIVSQDFMVKSWVKILQVVEQIQAIIIVTLVILLVNNVTVQSIMVFPQLIVKRIIVITKTIISHTRKISELVLMNQIKKDGKIF